MPYKIRKGHEMPQKVRQGLAPAGHCAQCGAVRPDLRQVEPRHGWGAAQSYGTAQTWCGSCRRVLRGQWRWTSANQEIEKARARVRRRRQ